MVNGVGGRRATQMLERKTSAGLVGSINRRFDSPFHSGDDSEIRIRRKMKMNFTFWPTSI